MSRPDRKMSTMEWMKSKANKTVVVEQYDGVEFEVETLFFMGRLPYRMMKDVNKSYFNQTKSAYRDWVWNV